MPSDFYAVTDKAIELLNTRAVKRFEDAKDKAAQNGFDELNVIEVVKGLYGDLRQDNQDIFLELAQERYAAAQPRGDDPPVLEWLLAILAAYNAVTKVIYDNDILRKQQYTTEGINSSTAKVTEFHRGLAYWSRMTAWYADIVTDEAVLKSFRDAGVRRVRWMTAGDEKVCEKCRSRNGKEYGINAIPPKPHPGCRCWYEPVT